jgi:hypothetical protein
MTSKTYTSFILPALKSELLRRGGDYILWQDRDSAHISKDTLRYMDLNGWDHITSPPKSPDMSISETWTSPLRRKFHERRCASEAAGVQRFYKVFNNLQAEEINKTVDAYPAWLHKLIKLYNGQATMY